jgi:hypothetical protein
LKFEKRQKCFYSWLRKYSKYNISVSTWSCHYFFLFITSKLLFLCYSFTIPLLFFLYDLYYALNYFFSKHRYMSCRTNEDHYIPNNSNRIWWVFGTGLVGAESTHRWVGSNSVELNIELNSWQIRSFRYTLDMRQMFWYYFS